MPRHSLKTNKISYQGEIGDKKFVPMYNSMLTNKNFISLSPLAKSIYIYMRLYSNGKMELDFPQRIYKNICSNGGFIKARNELVEKGFITYQYYESNQETTTGNYNTKKIKYKFSDEWLSITSEKVKRKKKKKSLNNLKKNKLNK